MAYVFISYSSKNQVAADHFKKILDQNGIRSWMAPGDIPLGSKYAQVISKAIKESSGLLLLMTDNAQNSVWVAKEVERAINYHKPLIPVMLEDVILNDEFEFYICNDQGISVNQIDENTQEMQQVLAILHKITSEDGSQESVSKYIVTKTPRMKRRLWLKRGLAGLLVLLLALVLLIVGVGIGNENQAQSMRHEDVKLIPTVAFEDAVRYYEEGMLWEKAIPPQLDEALKWYKKAAALEYGPSYLAVANVSVELGLYSQAAEFLLKAEEYNYAVYTYYQKTADPDDPVSMYRLSKAEIDGWGDVPDYERAMEDFLQAATVGHTESFCELGKLFMNSELGEPDLVKAEYWLLHALKLGSEEAEKLLQDLEKMKSE